ncbi:MAG: hypothetical protein K0S41_136 [Anaerocolumna sp.]|jgi:hypothetical protein|nr:hypothetical protein [Anaerocolumna sp.]
MNNELKEFDKEYSSIEDAMDEQSEDILELRYLTKDNCTFNRTEGGFVSLEYGEKKYDRVSVYRTFPFTQPDNYISIREPNEKAREIGIIKALTDLDKDQATMLLEQLQIRYFTPIITKIIDIKDEYGYAYFDVLTNYGACRFTIHMGGGSVVTLTDTRLLITDLDGNRFEIPDINTFSAIELKKLDLFI